MKKVFFASCMIVVLLLGTFESSTTEELFTVPKKKGKQSVNTIKKNNIETCTQQFRLLATSVQSIGAYQKDLLALVDNLLEHDDREFHQKQEPKLRKAFELAQRAQDLLVQSRQCLVD